MAGQQRSSIEQDPFAQRPAALRGGSVLLGLCEEKTTRHARRSAANAAVRKETEPVQQRPVALSARFGSNSRDWRTAFGSESRRRRRFLGFLLALRFALSGRPHLPTRTCNPEQLAVPSRSTARTVKNDSGGATPHCRRVSRSGRS